LPFWLNTAAEVKHASADFFAINEDAYGGRKFEEN
jgi:hypothetical protein